MAMAYFLAEVLGLPSWLWLPFRDKLTAASDSTFAAAPPAAVLLRWLAGEAKLAT